MATIGLLHPGEMGAALGRVLRDRGHDVLWASSARSEATSRRAQAAGLDDVQSVQALVERSEVIFSVCPPHAARNVAHATLASAGLLVDGNAIAPATARDIAAERDGSSFVDGGIVGPPPQSSGTTRLYLSGAQAFTIADLFEQSAVDARVVSENIGDASAVKMTYAAWSKGTAAMLIAIRDVARHYGVEEDLAAEWRDSVPSLPDRLAAAERSAAEKGWRWVGEMEEIAETFAAAGRPEGFHRAAAEVFRVPS